MNIKSFIIGILLTSVIAIGLELIFYYTGILQSTEFIWVINVFFIAFCVLIYILSIRAAESTNLNLFTFLILFSTLIKIMLSLIVLFAYREVREISVVNYLLPFFISYIAFTVFEVNLLTKQGKTQNLLKP
jgi:hypothetical protein